MTLSKTLLFGFVLISATVQIKSRNCLYKKPPHRKCEHKCCGISPDLFCLEDCDGIKCDSNNDCGDSCCRDNKCGDCPLSKAVIALIAVATVVFLAIVVFVTVRYCHRKQPSQMAVGQWTQLHNANDGGSRKLLC